MIKLNVEMNNGRPPPVWIWLVADAFNQSEELKRNESNFNY